MNYPKKTDFSKDHNAGLSVQIYSVALTKNLLFLKACYVEATANYPKNAYCVHNMNVHNSSVVCVEGGGVVYRVCLFIFLVFRKISYSKRCSK